MMRAHTLVRPSEYAGETRRRSPRPNLGSCDFSRHACPSRRQRVLHGQRPTASALPSGATSLSTGPWGVSPHGRTTRCHRVVRKQCTRRRRVARKSAYAQLPENIVPLDATGWHAHRALGATAWHGRALGDSEWHDHRALGDSEWHNRASQSRRQPERLVVAPWLTGGGVRSAGGSGASA